MNCVELQLKFPFFRSHNMMAKLDFRKSQNHRTKTRIRVTQLRMCHLSLKDKPYSDYIYGCLIIHCHRETILHCSKDYVGSLRVIFLNKSLNCLLFKTLTIYLEYIPLERDFAHYLKNFLYPRTIVNFVHLNQRLKSASRIELCPLSVVVVKLNFSRFTFFSVLGWGDFNHPASLG